MELGSPRQDMAMDGDGDGDGDGHSSSGNTALLERAKQISSSSFSDPLSKQLFFKVPPSLSYTNYSDAYKPLMFNFGLWHAPADDQQRLLHHDHHLYLPYSTFLFKQQAARAFCRLATASSSTSSNAFVDLVSNLMQRESELWECYGHCVSTTSSTEAASISNSPPPEKEAAALTMALDVVTVYVAATCSCCADTMEIGFNPPCIRSIVRADAVLLDNQLPMLAFRCLLQTLYANSNVAMADIDRQEEALLNLYAYQNSPFRHGWVYRQPKSDLQSLLGCIYDGWMGEHDDVELEVVGTMSSGGGHGRPQLKEFWKGCCSASDIRRSTNLTTLRKRNPSSGSVTAGAGALDSSDSSAAAASDGLPQRGEDIEKAEMVRKDCVCLNMEKAEDGGSICCTGTASPHAVANDNGTCTSRDFNPRCLQSAAHLYRCGIRFEAAAQQDSSDKPLNLATCITFDDASATLTLPRIVVVDGTQRFLLNLLAYEHTSRFRHPCTLLSYVCIMDMLINSADDVELLVEYGVLENGMGSHAQLATMWNGLREGYPFRLSPDHMKLLNDVRRVSKPLWLHWRHTFREMYYKRRPWLILSAFVAFAVLILALVQTIYAGRKSCK